MKKKDDGENLKKRREMTEGYTIMATNNSDVVVDSCFFYDVRWPIVCSRPCNEFTAKYGDLQSPDICNGCVASRTANGGTNHCRQTGNGYYDMGLPTEIKVKAADVSCPDGNCETIKVELGYGFTDADGNQRYIINPQMLNPGGRSIKFDEYDGGNAFKPGDIGYYYPKDYVKRTNAEVREVVPIYAGADTYDMTCTDVAPTLAYTGELNQDLNKTGVETIEDIVFTWGGGATDVSVTGIPTANMTKNTANKTLTISGKVNSLMAYTVTTKGGSGEAVSFSGTIYPIGYSAACGKMARIETTIGTAGTYEVNIYDASDKVMQTVYSGSMGTGTMSLIFAATDIDGGTYTWKLVNKADNKVAQTGTVEIP